MSQNPPQEKSGSFLVALGIFLSRIAGLVRDRVFAHYLGNSEAAGAFRAALRIPNFLQNLFGEGVLSASFIPVYTRLLAQKDPLAQQVAGVVGAILVLLVSILVALGVWLTPLLVNLIAPGFNESSKDLTIQIVRILFPGVGLLVLSAWCLGILNSHRQFFISYSAPVLWNVALILTLIIYGHEQSQSQLVETLAWGAVIGSFLQFAVQVPFVLKAAGKIPFRLNFKLKPVKNIFMNLGPVIMGRGVVQISAYIDSMIASFLGTAAVSSIAYAQTIYLLPVSLFGMAVAAGELPSMSASADEASHEKLKARVVASRQQIAFFVVPSTVVLILLGKFVVEALYQTGEFSGEDTLYVWYVLMASSVGLLAGTWGRLYSSVFYALQDTKTPFKVALLRVIVSVGLGVLFAFPLRGEIINLLLQIPTLRLPNIASIDVSIGAMGLALGSSLAGWMEFLILKFILQRRIGETPVSRNYLFQVWSIALGAAGVSLAAQYFILSEVNLHFLRYNLMPLVIIAIFGLVYLFTCRLFSVGEAKKLLRRLKI